MRITINELKETYKELIDKIEKETEESILYDSWNFLISHDFWQLKKVQKAFEKYIGTEDNPKRINPNPFDTPTYYLMKPSEQGNIEGAFMDEVLTGERKI